MAITINLPELGEGVDSVDVVAVLVAVGDQVRKDQGLIEVETEKASVEVPSTAAGTVTEIHVKEGDTLGENAPIVTLEEAETSAPKAEQEPVSVPAPVPDPDEGTPEDGTTPPADRTAEPAPASSFRLGRMPYVGASNKSSRFGRL